MKSPDKTVTAKPTAASLEQPLDAFEPVSMREIRRRLGWDMLEMERRHLETKNRRWNSTRLGYPAAGGRELSVPPGELWPG